MTVELPNIPEVLAQLTPSGGMVTTRWYKFFESISRKLKTQIGWTAATGVVDTGAYAIYTGTPISNPPTQAQVQAVDAELVKQSKRMVGLERALRTAGIIN